MEIQIITLPFHNLKYEREESLLQLFHHKESHSYDNIYGYDNIILTYKFAEAGGKMLKRCVWLSFMPYIYEESEGHDFLKLERTSAVISQA